MDLFFRFLRGPFENLVEQATRSVKNFSMSEPDFGRVLKFSEDGPRKR